MARVVGGEFEAQSLPRLHRKLFIECKGCVSGPACLGAGLGPGHYLRSDPLGSATALVVWDINARAAALAVFGSSPSEHQTRAVVDRVLELGGRFNTLQVALVGGTGNRTLRSVWIQLDKRLGLGRLPELEEGEVRAGPPQLFHGDRVHLVFNGAASWLGQPDI